MKILIGVDESPCSEAAVEYVRRAIWPAKTKVIVLSAVGLPVMAYAEPYAGAVAGEVTKDQMKGRQDLVSGVEEKLRGAGLTTEGRVPVSDAREAIVETALETGADLVVVGSHGRTGLPRLLMGSVASHVVAHAPCNVLVVKRPS